MPQIAQLDWLTALCTSFEDILMVIPSCKARAADLHLNSIGPFKLTMPSAVACQHVYILHAHYPQLTDAVYPYQILPELG